MLILRTFDGSPPSPRTIELSTASSEGRPVTPDALALEVARPGDPGLRDDRRERDLDEGHDPDHVAALLAGEGQVVDVEDRELRAPAEQELDAVGRGRGRLDAQVDALRAVEVALQRQVDAGVDRVGLEVEDELRRLVGTVLGVARAARRDERGDEGEHDEQRGSGPSAAQHCSRCAGLAHRRL